MFMHLDAQNEFEVNRCCIFAANAIDSSEKAMSPLVTAIIIRSRAQSPSFGVEEDFRYWSIEFFWTLAVIFVQKRKWLPLSSESSLGLTFVENPTWWRFDWSFESVCRVSVHQRHRKSSLGSVTVSSGIRRSSASLLRPRQCWGGPARTLFSIVRSEVGLEGWKKRQWD